MPDVSSKEDEQRRGERRQTGPGASYVGTDRRKVDRRVAPAEAQINPTP
jgi:hypothetical protein